MPAKKKSDFRSKSSIAANVAAAHAPSHAIVLLNPVDQARNILINDVRELAPRQICERIFAGAEEQLRGMQAVIHDYDDEKSPLPPSEARRRANELSPLIDRLTRAQVILIAAAEKNGA